MQTVILPGYSEKNKEWVSECANALTIEGIIRPVSWDHWQDPEAVFDAKEKGWLVARHARSEEINIVAKSIGTLIASFVIDAIPTQVKKVILLGIPLKDLTSEDKTRFLKGISLISPDQIICFQNDSDPHGNYNEVRDFLPDKFNLVKKVASTHEYPYYEDFNKFLL